MDYTDIAYFKLCNFAENNFDRNEIDLTLQIFAALCLQNLHIPTVCLAYYFTCICIFGALKFKPIIKSSYH